MSQASATAGQTIVASTFAHARRAKHLQAEVDERPHLCGPMMPGGVERVEGKQLPRPVAEQFDQPAALDYSTYEFCPGRGGIATPSFIAGVHRADRRRPLPKQLRCLPTAQWRRRIVTTFEWGFGALFDLTLVHPDQRPLADGPMDDAAAKPHLSLPPQASAPSP
jgi:hypothetical protein